MSLLSRLLPPLYDRAFYRGHERRIHVPSSLLQDTPIPLDQNRFFLSVKLLDDYKAKELEYATPGQRGDVCRMSE
ncbi:hypothetical protein E4U53_007626 [Claviceps sorghi]|nr:hypothetical protein E4U53_007626 [Claviceps sorghi]